MPTDENTQAVQQNWNPISDPNTTSNFWNSDDFDFDFDSEISSSASSNQDQVISQGRTWMFLTPDEEAEKEELQNSWQTIPVWQENVAEEDPALLENGGSYFPNVNINNNLQSTNSDSSGWNIDFDSDATDDSQNNKFDDKIENLISFDEDSSESSNKENVSVNVNETISENWDNMLEETTNNTLWWSVLENQQLKENENVVQNVDLNGQNIQDDKNTDSAVKVDWLNNNQNDDWLQQEDKKVEETFGTENVVNDQNLAINESPVDVAQNVENLLNNTTSDSENNPLQNSLDANNNIWNIDTSLPDWLWQHIDPQTTEPNYIPNEADFSAMSNLLNSSNVWQVDLNNVNNQTENNINVDNNAGWIGTTFNSDLMQDQWNWVVSDTSNSLENISNTIEDSTQMVENTIEPVIMQPNIGNEQGNIWFNNQENVADNNVVPNQFVQMDEPIQETTVNQGVDLNSIGVLWWSELWNMDNNMWSVENQWVPLDAIIDQEIQNMHVQPQTLDSSNAVWTVNIDQQQAQNIQVQNNKRKKQSWFKVIWIFFLACLILWGVIYWASVMFPDKFKKIFKYLTWNENESGMENNNQNVENNDSQNENLENNEWIEENNWELDENIENWEESNVEWTEANEDWEDVDPNSLAWLLSADENWNESNTNSEENTENNWLIDSENVDTENIDTENGWVEEEDFDPFSQIENVLSEEKSDYDKLTDYITQWTYYKELWISKNDKKMERSWDYIIFTATEELTKLENWEEIDNSVYGRLDWTLESLQG